MTPAQADSAIADLVWQNHEDDNVLEALVAAHIAFDDAMRSLLCSSKTHECQEPLRRDLGPAGNR